SALEDSTKSVTTASMAARLQFMLARPVIVDGTTYTLGSPEWREANAYVLTDELDRQLRLLDPEERKRTVDHLRRELMGTYGNAGPFAAQLIRAIRSGDPSMPYEKRPTWGAMAPLEMLELQVRGQKAVQDNYSLGQQGIEQRLNSLWYGTPEQRGPGSLDPLDPGYPAALLRFRDQALGMGYANPEEFIAKRAKSQGEFTEAVRPPDPFLAEDFVAQIRNISPSTWTDDPNAYANAQQQARDIASREPNRQAQRDTYQRLMGEIDKARSAAGDLDKGVLGFIENQVMQDLDSDAVRQIRDKQKVNGQQGSALAQQMQQQRAGGATATEAVASVYQNTKLTAFANQTRELYIRAVSKAINDWKAENPGRSLGPAQRSVVMSQAAAEVRKSPQYERLVQQLTGRKPGQVGPATVGPGKVGTDPRAARGVPREAARNLSDDQIRTVDRRPVMNARWVYSELQQLQRGKPFSAELNNLARRANTTPLRYLQQNLRYWRSDLDPQGEVMRYLDDRIRREKPARTVAGNQISSILPDGLGGWDPLAAGGWLMGMIAPPAAAATMPPPAVALPSSATRTMAVRSGPATGGSRQSWDNVVAMARSKGAKFPELVAAQWALESDWGRSPSGRNNFFGQKGRGTRKATWEVVNGRRVNTTASFMDFASPADSVGFLIDRWYRGSNGANRARTVEEAARILKQQGYATDPEYVNKLLRIVRGNRRS
ncbi:MAG: glucosaminidase domain-containing protein, partial [Synechococcaceae cyanobacterium]|nr:glucosaminidase domain-containing protein [Synechococcaceae cyanobacterium]